MDQEKSLRLLEFHKIRGLLADLADTEDGRAGCMALSPSDDFEQVQQELARTQAALKILNLKGPLSMRGLRNVSDALKRLRVEAALSIPELMDCAFLLRTARRLREYRGDGEALESVLDGEFARIVPHKALEDRLYASFNAEGEALDTASDELYRIRRQIASAQSRVRESLDKLIRSAQYARCLQEPVVTVRGGRFVVPVKVEYKGEISGLVHDVSATGATVFIEPASVVEANNEVRLLEGREKAEIERIVYELSALLSSVCEDLEDDYLMCTRFDILFARAKLAVDMRATMPVVNDRGIVDLRRARHPLLDRDTVVPVDIALGQDYDTLVITGPNTGGKTVSLKLIGLVSAMAQAGLYIPCAEESRCAVFDNILTDVGDEQSIEQSLSTFSSHMTNIIQIIDKATARSLCLFDELGAGTDPVEGAALSVAILEYVRDKGARIVCTTHFPELKVYALQTAGVRNASCEFDVETLRPTYRLITGMPGRSNAFAISEKLGLKKEIIEQAATHLTSDSIAFEEILAQIEKNRRASERERDAAMADRAAAAAQLQNAQQKQREMQARIEKELEQVKGQGRRIVEGAKAQVQEVLAGLDALVREKERADFKERLQGFKQRTRRTLRELEDELDPVHEAQTEYELPRPLRIGDTVEVVGITRAGVVASLPGRDGKLVVTAGSMKLTVNVKDVRLIKAPKKRAPYTPTEGPAVRRASDTLHVRGMTVAEMEPELEQFLDSAVMAGLHEVTVVHGKGTGALRAAVWDYLRGHPHVKSFRAGRFGEGEQGVTVIELKEKGR